MELAVGLIAGLILGAGAAALLAWRRLGRVRRAERRARDAERLASLGALAGGLAHEIKNPLSTLNINLQLLEEDLRRAGEDPKGRYLMRLGTLRREVRRLEEVLDDFLRYARPHELKTEAVDLNGLLDEMLDFVSPEVTQSGVRISRGFAPDLKPCRIDAGRLKQAFLNIVINAKQAMSAGGELIVRTRNVENRGRSPQRGAGWIGEGFPQRGASPFFVEIDFIDTGAGIAPENLPRIWDAYYSTKDKGTGLGLPTARRIIEEHGGTIRVHSDVGKGTCFTVFLPSLL